MVIVLYRFLKLPLLSIDITCVGEKIRKLLIIGKNLIVVKGLPIVVQSSIELITLFVYDSNFHKWIGQKMCCTDLLRKRNCFKRFFLRSVKVSFLSVAGTKSEGYIDYFCHKRFFFIDFSCLHKKHNRLITFVLGLFLLRFISVPMRKKYRRNIWFF